MSGFYVTTFCNFAHRLSDGKPLEHECYVIPPRLLRAERDDDPNRDALWRHWSGTLRTTHRGMPPLKETPMDPDATLKEIEEYPEGANAACTNLFVWLVAGCFSPNWARYPKGTDHFIRWLVDSRQSLVAGGAAAR